MLTSAWSLEDGMVWSPLHTFYFTFFGALCHGRVRLRSRTFLKVNEGSPGMTYSINSRWSSACSLNTVAPSLSMEDPTTTTITVSSMPSCSRRGPKVIWRSIGLTLVAKFVNDKMGAVHKIVHIPQSPVLGKFYSFYPYLPLHPDNNICMAQITLSRPHFALTGLTHSYQGTPVLILPFVPPLCLCAVWPISPRSPPYFLYSNLYT